MKDKVLNRAWVHGWYMHAIGALFSYLAMYHPGLQKVPEIVQAGVPMLALLCSAATALMHIYHAHGLHGVLVELERDAVTYVTNNSTMPIHWTWTAGPSETGAVGGEFVPGPPPPSPTQA